jgi:hypothetical protein
MRRDERHRARFARLIRLYPQEFRDQFASAMEQTFADMYADRQASGRSMRTFLAMTYLDTSIGVVKEHIVNGMRARPADHPRLAAVSGTLLLLPFVGLNLVVVHRIEPIFSLIRRGTHTGPLEYILLVVSLLALPFGAAIALAPVLPAIRERRKIPLLNTTVAALLVAVFVPLAVGFGEEVVRCDLLQIKGCD